MAITITQLNAISNVWAQKKLTDQVYLTNALLKVLYDARVKLDGGTKITAPVISGAVDSTTGGWYSGLDTLNAAPKDDITRAEIDWKQIYETVLLSKADINKNNGDMQILQLLKSKIEIAQFRLKSRLGSGVHNDGTVTDAFNGLQQIIHASGSYAGLAVADILDEAGNSSWVSYILGNSSVDRALSLRHIQQTMGRATIDADKPTHAVCKQDVLDEVIALLAPHQRLATSDEMKGMGFKGVLEYNGIPFLVDSHAKAKSISFINKNHFKMYVHTAEDMLVEKFDKLESKNGVQQRVLLMANVLCDGRRYLSRVDDIAVSA
jgi:hypothetical protein